MTITNELLSMLKNLIPAIKGKWFISDGALLGITRDHSLLEWDDDIDIYLIEGEGSIDIDILNLTNLKYEKSYSCDKISIENNPIIKSNSWIDWCSYTRMKYPGKNRAQICKLAALDYKENKIINKVTYPYIDIFYLKKKDDRYVLKDNLWKYIYYDFKTKINSDLGFDINIPVNQEEVCKMIYGDDWNIPNKKFLHN